MAPPPPPQGFGPPPPGLPPPGPPPPGPPPPSNLPNKKLPMKAKKGSNRGDLLASIRNFGKNRLKKASNRKLKDPVDV